MKNILFVCLGNICRSPAAEEIFRVKSKKAGLELKVDSCGTGGWHVGESPDDRMQKHALKRGYTLSSMGRQLNPKKDFDDFDLIIVMDETNLEDVLSEATKQSHREKIFKMTDFSKNYDYTKIPDPYNSGPEGFELVLNLLEDAVDGLIDYIKNEDE